MNPPKPIRVLRPAPDVLELEAEAAAGLVKAAGTLEEVVILLVYTVMPVAAVVELDEDATTAAAKAVVEDEVEEEVEVEAVIEEFVLESSKSAPIPHWTVLPSNRELFVGGVDVPSAAAMVKRVVQVAVDTFPPRVNWRK